MKKFKIPAEHFAAVLCYHRIGDPYSGKEPISDGLKVSPDLFEKTINYFLKNGYSFISLDELSSYMSEEKMPYDNKNICLTFDDGYKDNLYDLLPIAEKYNIPFAVYVAAYAPDGKLFTWWNTLEELLLNNDRLILSDGSVYECETMDKKWNSFWALREKVIAMAKGVELEEVFTKLFASYTFDLYHYSLEQYLNWKELKKLKASPLCTIALHTCTHLALDVSSPEVIEKEMIESQKIMKQHLGYVPRHFAYPFGAYDQKSLEIMKKFQPQIKTFTTTDFGYVSTRTNKLLIPRIASIEQLLFNQYLFHWSDYKGKRFIKGLIKIKVSRKNVRCELFKILNMNVCCLKGYLGGCEFKFTIGEEK